MSAPFQLAADKIATWRRDPRIMVRELFNVVPDQWQDEALEAFPHSPRLAMKACAGPGKTAMLAWIGWNFLLTRPHPKGGCTSISGANLKANLWTELAHWRNKSPLLLQEFDLTGKEIFYRKHPKTWKLEARTWAKDANAEQIGNALRGVHGDYVMWLLDESGGYPDSILPVVENIFAGNPVEAHVVQAGNPTNLSGPLYRAAVRARDLWRVIEITGDPDDPKRSPRISIEHARQQIRQYGRDNPWVLINIFGQFPPSSLNSLIGLDECTAATKRSYKEQDIEGDARIMGVDVAREGDDASVLFQRQGLVAFTPKVWRNIDGVQGAGAVSHLWREWDADACFVDNTGGFGASWIDQLRVLRRAPIPVLFSGKANELRYANKRAEMYFAGVQWIKDGGQIPDCPELIAALTETTYTFRGDSLLLEDKDQIKDRLGYSPDHADGFVLTFAQHVAPRSQRRRTRNVASAVPGNYNPFAQIEQHR